MEAEAWTEQHLFFVFFFCFCFSTCFSKHNISAPLSSKTRLRSRSIFPAGTANALRENRLTLDDDVWRRLAFKLVLEWQKASYDHKLNYPLHLLYCMNYLLSLSVASECQGFNDLMHNVSKHIHRCRLDTGLNGKMLNGLKDFTQMTD